MAMLLMQHVYAVHRDKSVSKHARSCACSLASKQATHTGAALVSLELKCCGVLNIMQRHIGGCDAQCEHANISTAPQLGSPLPGKPHTEAAVVSAEPQRCIQAGPGPSTGPHLLSLRRGWHGQLPRT